MRITGGDLRSRRFDAPHGDRTRPTSDKVREALFSVLGHHVAFDDAVVVDAFAGSGGLAFEALSRGATRAFVLEEARGALRTIAANATALELSHRITVIAGDIERTMTRIDAPVRVAFFDPPYALVPTDGFAKLLHAFCEHVSWEDGALLVLEHRAGDHVPTLDGWDTVADRVWGDTGVRIARLA